MRHIAVPPNAEIYRNLYKYINENAVHTFLPTCRWYGGDVGIENQIKQCSSSMSTASGNILPQIVQYICLKISFKIYSSSRNSYS